MLKLKRKVGQTIEIDNVVWIQIAEIRGKTVSLRFKAPESVKILRGELIHKVNENENSDRVR